ncbi:hypothetical protein [Micromonospora sp. NBC_01796]|uniref:hypothetical protein n=1 Tax=Micromonospora sp. NBC_01796 TaxID=2975987 RepID=UPI002DD9CC9B|nr:hypothetical protein [Micromonospora sp. NBC_01796]WSA83265.1 hypothetical protein OIE47_22975 [Micromonospora sp. NBC_01796]
MTSVPAQPAAPPTETPAVTGDASTVVTTTTGTVVTTAETQVVAVTGDATVEVATDAPTVAVSADLPTVAVTTRPGPTKVRIETPGATIDIEAHEPLGEVVATALRLFHEAGGWPREQTRSAGFAQTERRDFPPPQSSSMPYAPGAYPVQSP